MTPDEMDTSPWAMVPKTGQMAPSATSLAAPAALTPDQLYPSFPNPAGLGSGVPFDMPPIEVPVDSYQPPMQMPMAMPSMEMLDEPAISPWSLLRGGQGELG
jgi:hypothetical protein